MGSIYINNEAYISVDISSLDCTLRFPTCNIRVITGIGNEFITCPLPPNLLDQTLRSGPGIVTNADGQIIDIDSGLIN
jgi:hypothetical protein